MSNHPAVLREIEQLRRLIRLTGRRMRSGQLSLYTGGMTLCKLTNALTQHLLVYQALTQSHDTAREAEAQRILSAVGLNDPTPNPDR